MILKQSELFSGLKREFVKSIVDLTEKETFGKGDRIFTEGDPARGFYVLLKGRVKLTIGDDGRLVHTVGRGGEVFGWSSLVGRETYSASAICATATKLLRIEGDEFQRLLEDDPASGFVLMRGLAATIGGRLINAYNSLVMSHRVEAHETDGTQQTLHQKGAA
jgi:CRP-like cAMP-binding protein